MAKQNASLAARHPPTADDMARMRTIMAADRTLMAWIRTTLSMISFGFTIYKFLQYLYEAENTKLDLSPRGPRNLGLTLIALGLVALVLACVQYWREVKVLDGDREPVTLPLVVAGFVGLIGTLALMNVLFRIGPF
jgi:putative membrane protein